MKNFDEKRAEREARDRTFRIAGRDFGFRAAISPDDFAEYTDLVSGRLHEYGKIPVVRDEDDGAKNGTEEAARESGKEEAGKEKEEPKERLVILSGPTESESIAILDRTIEAFLLPDYREQWREARSDRDVENPITSSDMYEVIGFMWEVVTGRPTKPPSASTSGRAESGTPSTPASPSPEALSSTA